VRTEAAAIGAAAAEFAIVNQNLK
jgi:hypothetical protein